MKTVVISNLYPQFCEELKGRGYKICPTNRVEVFHKPEQLHADMQVLKISDTVFTLKECDYSALSVSNLISCEKPAEKDYPKNILLNCLYLNGKLFGKISAVDASVLTYCKRHGIEPINVNQGYTRCSTLKVNEKAIITADKSIARAAEEHGIEVCLISPGCIVLEGFDYGFIGGCSMADEDKIYFFGNIKKHSDYHKIKAFCDKHNSKAEILCNNFPPTDIGGAVVL